MAKDALKFTYYQDVEAQKLQINSIIGGYSLEQTGKLLILEEHKWNSTQ